MELRREEEAAAEIRRAEEAKIKEEEEKRLIKKGFLKLDDGSKGAKKNKNAEEKEEKEKETEEEEKKEEKETREKLAEISIKDRVETVDVAAPLSSLTLSDRKGEEQVEAGERKGNEEEEVSQGEGKEKKLIQVLNETSFHAKGQEDKGQAAAREGQEAAREGGGVKAHAGDIPVTFRQNQKNITAVVRVENIIEESLVVDFSPSSLLLSFSAKHPADSITTYSQKILLAGLIDPIHCRHDVSAANAVIVLRKVSDVRWTKFTRLPDELDPATETEQAEDEKRGQEEKEEHEKMDGKTEGKESKREEEEERISQEKGMKEEKKVTEDLLAFQPAEKFLGSRKGMVFKMGEFGLGYYKDVQQVSSRWTAEKGGREGEGAQKEGEEEQDMTKDDAKEGKTSEGRKEEEVVEEEESVKEQTDQPRAGPGEGRAKETEGRRGGEEERKEKSVPKLGFTNHIMFDLD
mmetsp:Transcript_18931/g.62221  ORF Transcript_18931/g.62221 Transcript_18931/m.62221 type:complete len:462 (-) Transcript_18931:141-1526(-)